MPPLIRARSLVYEYPDGTHALRGVDLEVRPGETLVLLGPNGSGKTTFLLHLNGILRGTGELHVCGLEVNAANLPAIRARVGLLFQDPDDQLFMPTVIDDVSFAPLNYGVAPSEAERVAREALERVGVAHLAGKSPQHLSSGEKRRVAIAGVLAANPEVLLLDEPTTYLDPPGERELLHLLRALPQAKLVVTHDVAFARAIATRAVFFDKGKAIDEGTVDELVERFDWRPE